MLDVAPIGIHRDQLFDEPHLVVPADTRRKHMALFGATGTGKSTLLTNMAAADLDAGTGITVVDPHGGFCEDILTNHIPRRRKNDVILFDPKSRTHAVGLNILYCPRKEQRGLVVSNVVSTFHTLWISSWGARLEDTLRNALWVLIEQPRPTSLLDLPTLLTNEGYRADMLRRVENPALHDFFENTFNRWTSSFREEVISSVLNKTRAFTTDPMMRAIIGQSQARFHFRWMMDHRKVLLCNLPKGLIGDDNSRLLGSLIVLQEKLAAMSREDIPEGDRVPHVLYVEEAQNFIADFESILQQTRKYELMLTLATQGPDALSTEAVYAIFNSCATMGSFRVSAHDANRIGEELGLSLPTALHDIPDYTLYVRTLTQGKKDAGASPSGPHHISSYPPLKHHPRRAWRESVIEVSQARYAKPRRMDKNQLPITV
jgi:type IV secretory pathway TraG/TraD family ATPase VirD4